MYDNPSMLIRVRSTTRQTPRHAVDIPCEIITPTAESPTLSWATDMSADGLWLDATHELALGDELVVCFQPGIFWRAHELMVFATVTRTSPGARDDDDGPGRGLAFLDLGTSERWALRSWLRPRPEKAPSRRRRARPSTPRLAPYPVETDGFMASPFARRLS